MNETGEIVLDLGPGPDNPRNSEGDFIYLADGRLMCVYSRYSGNSWDDFAPADLAVMYSADHGRSWTEPELLLDHAVDGAQNVMSVTLRRLRNGDIGLFYFLMKSVNDGRLWLRRSADEGSSWTDPVPCTTGPGYYVTNNDRVTELRGGRLIVPAAQHRILEKNGQPQWDSRAVTFFFCSDDDGHTWQESNPCAVHAPHSRSGLQEPGVIEKEDGTLYAWARTDIGMQYEMISADRGDTWSEPVPSIFSSATSPLSMKRIPGSGALLAVWNPVPNYSGRPINRKVWDDGRTPLVYAVSRDDGRSWGEPAVLEDDPFTGYCYVTIFFTRDNQVLLAYCAGGPEDDGCLNRLRIRKMPLPE